MTAVAGLLTTLSFALLVAYIRAAPRQHDLAGPEQEPVMFELGQPPEPSVVDAAVFPLERYVLAGELEWEPLLLQWHHPDFARGRDAACRPILDGLDADAVCLVDYTFVTDPTPANGEGSGVVFVRAAVMPATSDPCRRYVACRLPELLEVRLAVPLAPGSPSTRVVIDKVTHSTRAPADLRQEIAQLEGLVAEPEPPEFGEMPPPMQRLQRFIVATQRQRLGVLRERQLGGKR